MLERMWKKMNPYTLLMGMQVLAATMENSMEIPQKTKNRATMHVHAKTLQSCPACATLWTAACWAPLSIGFSREEFWSWLPCPTLGHLPNSGSNLFLLSPPALSGRFLTSSITWKAPELLYDLVVPILVIYPGKTKTLNKKMNLPQCS